MLSSKPPVQTIKRIPKGASKVIVEPFDIPVIEEFKPLNNTRKVYYPMMLEKYEVTKYDEASFDDFRIAIDHIATKKNNNELFTQNLNEKSGRFTRMNHEKEST